MKILLVEDDVDLRELLCMDLSLHYQVLEAENGLLGLELFKKESPDLIISDVKMPLLSGFELLCEVKKISSVPFIIMTGFSDESKDVFLNKGAQDVLFKPFSLLKLKESISSLIKS